MYGGEVRAAPLPGRGFSVTARFPLAGTADAPGMTIRVLVADDQALVRGSFRILVDTAPDLTSVGEAATGTEAVEIARREKPDIVLMDIRMPGMDGIEATRQIIADPQTSAVRVLILTTFDLDEYVFAALRAGASGFLLKDTRPADLLTAIRVVAAGDALLAPAITRRLIEEFTKRPEPRQPPAAVVDEITEREREVLHPGRARPVQHRDRRPPACQPVHREDARRPAADEARCTRPRPTRHRRLQHRACPAAISRVGTNGGGCGHHLQCER